MYSAPGSELPLDKIGLLSSLSFRWLNEYLLAGYRNGMKDKTLPSLSKRETCDVNGPRCCTRVCVCVLYRAMSRSRFRSLSRLCKTTFPRPSLYAIYVYTRTRLCLKTIFFLFLVWSGRFYVFKKI